MKVKDSGGRVRRDSSTDCLPDAEIVGLLN